MSDNKKIIIVVLLIAIGALLAGCASQAKTVKAGDNVSVDYLGWYDNGTIFDTSNATIALENNIYNPYSTYTPISFVVGNNEVIPGFENATIGMKVGETKNVTLMPADAYGEYDPTAIIPINMSEFNDINVTPTVNMTLSDVFYWPVRVDSIQINESDYNNSTVFVDFNNPMAGKSLHFMITVRSIETPVPTK
jgi:peptidylprolyl isomerase